MVSTEYAAIFVHDSTGSIFVKPRYNSTHFPRFIRASTTSR